MTLQDNITNKIIITNFTIMKKYLFLISVAAVTMTACTSETEEYVGSEQSREISFSPIAQKATRAAVIGTTFPTANTMEVAAYQSAPSGANYFSKTTFSNVANTNTWSGNKYWPVGVSKLNFFAVSAAGVDASDITIADNLSTATVSYKTTGNTSSTAYSNTSQSDIMYAFARGSVTTSGSNFVYNNVSMGYAHALSLISFTVKATNTTGITVNYIKLNGASYTGSLALANTGATASSGDVTTTLTWTADAAVSNVTVPNISGNLTTSAVPSDGSACLMIIPKSSAFTNFVINYTMSGNTYNYTYQPSGSVTAEAGKKYTYNIEFSSNAIIIAPTVAAWTEGTGGGTINVQ